MIQILFMIKHIIHGINYLRSVTRDIGLPKRSPQWHKLEKTFLESNPTCEVCGSKNKLNVHHIKPFHLHPELELDPKNLITLCMDKKESHLRIGHGSDFKAFCSQIKKYAEEINSKEKIVKCKKWIQS